MLVPHYVAANDDLKVWSHYPGGDGWDVLVLPGVLPSQPLNVFCHVFFSPVLTWKTIFPGPHEPLKPCRKCHAAIERDMNASLPAASDTAQSSDHPEDWHPITPPASIYWQELGTAQGHLRMARDVHPDLGLHRPSQLLFNLTKHGINFALLQVQPLEDLPLGIAWVKGQGTRKANPQPSNKQTIKRPILLRETVNISIIYVLHRFWDRHTKAACHWSPRHWFTSCWKHASKTGSLVPP